MIDDVRWKQRFENFQRALNQLNAAVRLSETRPLTDLEKQGLIQGFEFTHVSGPGRLRGTFMKSSGFSAYHLFMASMGGTCPRAFWGMW